MLREEFDDIYRHSSAVIESGVYSMTCGTEDYLTYITEDYNQMKFGDWERRFEIVGENCPTIDNYIHTVFDVSEDMIILQTEYDVDYTDDQGFISPGYQNTHAIVTYKVIKTSEGSTRGSSRTTPTSFGTGCNLRNPHPRPVLTDPGAYRSVYFVERPFAFATGYLARVTSSFSRTIASGSSPRSLARNRQ